MSGKTSWTPGPWTYLPDSNIIGTPSTWHDDDGAHHDLRFPRVIAEIPDDWDQSRHGPLIAAAPELYDALEAASRFVACNNNFSETTCRDVLAKVDAALAKARGEA